MRRGRRRYGSRYRSDLQAAAKEIIRSITQVSLRGDVVEKNDGRKANGRQDSAARVTWRDLKRRRLTIYAPRILSSRTGTPHSRPGSSNDRQTVKPTREMSRTGQEFKTHPHIVRTAVYNWISRMKVALIAMISTYVWNLGQTKPMVGIKEPLQSKYYAQLSDCGMPGKIQLLQIPETFEDRSAEVEKDTLRATFFLSPRKLKKTSGVHNVLCYSI